MRNIHKDIKNHIKPQKWNITEEKFDYKTNTQNETLFALSNGYIGIRGFFEEGIDKDEYSDPTVLINGIYEYYDYKYIWKRPGFPDRRHAVIHQVNPIDIIVKINGKIASCIENNCNYKRTFNLKEGILYRSFTYNVGEKLKAELMYERLVSKIDKHIMGIRITIKTSADCNLEIISTLNNYCYRSNISQEELQSVKPLQTCRLGDVIAVSYQTKRSGFKVACAAADKLNSPVNLDKNDSENSLCNNHTFNAQAEKTYSYERIIAFASNNDIDEYLSFAIEKANKYSDLGFEFLKEKEKENISKFWSCCDIEIEGDDAIQQGIRFSLYHIYQSVGKDGKTNISANGLTGSIYSGHVFWDTEIFMQPMFTYSLPEITKQLINYRYNILDKARERAAQMEDQGALYSWNSINGEECGIVFEAVTAQYHINCDIFYSIYKYIEATKDEDFLINTCAEILFEITKCISHRGHFNKEKDGQFCIDVICGPDEYNPIVDNNLYTNWLAKKMFSYTAELAESIKSKYPLLYDKLIKKCEINDEEIERWKKAAQKMYLAYNKEKDIYMQDDNFMFKQEVDLEKIPLNRLPLLNTQHPLNLWRYQICKQADIILLIYLFSNEFTQEMKEKIFNYYEPKTIHDSSLSASIHSIVACDIGKKEQAYGYLKQSCRMDLDDYNRNARFGIHAACMGASYMMIVNGYGGLRIYGNILHFKPFLPEEWKCFSFKIRFNGTLLSVKIFDKYVLYKVIENDGITITHYGKIIKLLKNKEHKENC